MKKNKGSVLLGLLCIAIVVCIITLIVLIYNAAIYGTAEKIIPNAEVLGVALLVTFILSIIKSAID